MLARIQERRFELLFIIIATVVIGKISIRNLLVTGQELGQQVQAREMKIQRLKAEDIMLSAQIGALEAEIDRLIR
jgi:cell division protein FtsB